MALKQDSVQFVVCPKQGSKFYSGIHWAIPENIHTIPRTASRISEGEGGFTIMEF